MVERAESMAPSGAPAVAPQHISGVLSDICQDRGSVSFKLDELCVPPETEDGVVAA